MRWTMLFLLALATSLAAQTTRYVDASVSGPGAGTVTNPFASIQAGIAQAAPGDLVLVAPGVYVEQLDFLGKAITVRGAQGAAATTVDAQQAGPVVVFDSGEGPSSVLEGFELTGGLGAPSVNGFAVPNAEGGGIHCRNTSPTIRACHVRQNQGGQGATLVLVSGGLGGAGGVDIEGGAPLLDGCVVESNTGGDGSLGGGAGGVSSRGASAVLRRCTILGNHAGLLSDAAGGVQAATSSILFDRCLITGNVGGVRRGSGGVGLVDAVGARVERCEILDNFGGQDLPGGFPRVGGAGGISIEANCASIALSPVLAGCVIAGNVGGDGAVGTLPGVARGGPGGVHCRGTAPNLIHCVVADNVGGAGVTPAESGGGGIEANVYCALAVISNTIVWGNTGSGTAGDSVELKDGASTYAVVSDIEGGLPGFLIADVDPRFADPAARDYRLRHDSPVRDAGSNLTPDYAALAPLLDLAGDPRLAGAAPDLGADEYCRPGSLEDFVLDVTLDGDAAPRACRKVALAGQTMVVRISSPGGALLGASALMVAQFIPPVPYAGFPEVNIDGAGLVLLATPSLTAGGLAASGVVAPGLAGLVLRLQALAISSIAGNGFFATTHAPDVVLQ